MRWERLFDDLEGQWQAEARLAERAEVADRTRRERALVSWSDRLLAHEGAVGVLLLNGRRLAGEARELGQDFAVFDEGGTQRLVPLAVVLEVTGLGRRVVGAQSAVTRRRMGIGAALRVIARDRSVVTVEDVAGRVLVGTIEVVGADYVEMVEHPEDRPRREDEIRARRVLPIAALACVSSR